MRIAICDDEAPSRGAAIDIASDYQEERKDKNLIFEAFSSPEALLEAVHKNGGYDIYILDIVMPGMNGIKLGQALRAEGQEGKIIYLTSSDEHALDSFRVRAFDYVLKPVTKESFYAFMDEAVSSINVKKDKVLLVKTKEDTARVAFDSILYTELKGRAVVYHLSGGSTVTGTTLRIPFTEAVRELLSDKRFTLCGASMAANLHRITSVETDGVVFDGTESVFLGKKACRELRSVWSNYWINSEE